MSKELDEKLIGVLNQYYGIEQFSLGKAIAEIKAAFVAELPEEKSIENIPIYEDYLLSIAHGYNQAIKDITEKLK